MTHNTRITTASEFIEATKNISLKDILKRFSTKNLVIIDGNNFERKGILLTVGVCENMKREQN
jgi:hypothetical protein